MSGQHLTDLRNVPNPAPRPPVPAPGGASFASAALALALALGAADDAAAQNVCRGDPPADPAQRIVCEEVSGSANIVIRASNLDIATSGAYARGRGVLARRVRAGGSIGIDIDGGAIATSGEGASGVYVWHSGAAGAVGIDLNDAVVTTSGAYANGVWGDVTHPHNVAALTVGVTGGAVTAEGVGAVGVGARHDGLGSVALTVGAGAEVRAPFSIGAEGRLGRHHGNPDERLVVSHGGTIEARDTGILAWAARRSGHTFGAGAQHADDAARTEPMVHVTSSGDVTVGEAATDAFIRAAIAGADGALSAGEKAVYAAIVAEDSEELGTALAALPAADYDAAWRARANALLTKRGHEPTRVAEEILGLTRSGIRALALPLEIIVAWVQEGVETTSTLSAAERTVLAAVLTGGDLEAALAALPRGAGYDYDDNWKNEMREWAASYNAGDVLVEVTGGTITAEGDGVDARYALTHDRNGAIAVSVADGATVSGGRHGVHVGGAGLVAGNAGLRDQTVTVTGAVRGGTGAGVHLAGGGTVVVGRTGRVGATSGDGILSEGAGDLVATVAGTVEGDVRATGGGDLDATVSGTVKGDLRAEGGGALTVDVKEGGAVTGTVHDPAGPLTVHGSIGRLIYASGGTVTVAGTGRLTGVEGESETIRSEAGDLDVSVAGTVAGDLRAPSGGALTVDVKEGGAVTGTVHDPAGPLTVHGSIGRLVYASGGTVTVAGTGRLTGVEGESEAIRSEAGNLDVSVAGTVAGDLRAPAGGTLTLAVPEGGAVTGTVHDPAGPLTVRGSIGRLVYANGGTVTVAATGRLAGVVVEGRREAVRSEAGDLNLDVAAKGMVSGDVRALGGGDLDATISGTVEGDLRALGGGALTVDVKEGGAVTGTVHDPAGPLTVRGSIGRVLYGNGGTVTVAGTGRLTGVVVEGEGEAIRSEAGDLNLSVAAMGSVAGDVIAEGDGDLSAMVAGTLTGDLVEEGAGDLSATISGRVEGDVFGRGTGEHTVTVSSGGVVTGTIDLSASTVRVDGAAGQVRFDKGGTVMVGAAGRLTGIAGVAVRNEAGGLAMGVAGRVEGAIIGLGARPARVTTEPGSAVTGIDLAGAGSAVRVGGTAERVRFRGGGTVTVGPQGSAGRVSSDAGELVAEAEQGSGESAAQALRRAFPGEVVEAGGTPTIRTRKPGEPAQTVGAPGTGAALPDGARDVGLEETERGVRVARALAPRSRVYEALPSVLLGLNGPTRYEDRMAAARSTWGGWARVAAARGKNEADASTSQTETGVGLEYRHRGHGVEAGLAGAWGEAARVGASLHHRRSTATVSQGGRIALHGTGAGVSGTWLLREETYLDVQAEMTWYEADLSATGRGVLKKDVSGHGHALGVEAGRRLSLAGLPAGVVLTPRAGLVHSRVDVGGFTDATGSRVTVDDPHSLLGRVGVGVEATPGGSTRSRVFGSLEVEHEFSNERKVWVSGTRLRSEVDATWLRVGVNGVHATEDGRWTFSGGLGYATSGGSYELGGGLSLHARF